MPQYNDAVQPKNPVEETRLRRLHTQFCNANNPMEKVLAEIQSKLHSIVNLNYPKETTGEKGVAQPMDNQEGGIAYELEVQMDLAHRNTNTAEAILRHLNEII